MTSSGSAEEKQEEIKGRFRLLYDLTWQMFSFGPVLATKMSVLSSISLPWGLGAAGAETVKQGVDADDAEGIARMTAIMVKLGMLGTVHDIVVSLCSQERADAVAEVTSWLLSQGEVWTVAQITNALVASSHVNEVVSISGNLVHKGNLQILEVVKEAGVDMNLLSGPQDKGGKGDKSGESGSAESDQGDSAGASGNGAGGSGIIEGIQQQAASTLDRITPGTREGKEDKESEEEGRTPDADALFSDWTGVKAEDAKGYEEKPASDDPEAPKEERLL